VPPASRHRHSRLRCMLASTLLAIHLCPFSMWSWRPERTAQQGTAPGTKEDKRSPLLDYSVNKSLSPRRSLLPDAISLEGMVISSQPHTSYVRE